MAKRVIQKKICLLGDFAVGKTSLVRRFVEGRFDDKYLSTIGVKISRKVLEHDDHDLNMLVWDLAGSDNFGDMTNMYLRGVAGALIVCDLTRSETFNSLKLYTGQLRDKNPDVSIIFLGNKADLIEERAIEENEILELAESLNVSYLLTSAKTGFQVETAFQILGEKLIG